MKNAERKLPWIVDLLILFGILFLIALFALITWPVFRIMDIGQPEEMRVAKDLLRVLFDPGEIVPRAKSSYE